MKAPLPAHDPAAAKIRVMCVDDHPVLRQGLAAILASDPGVELVAQAGSGEEAIAAFQQCRPDVTLMDLRLPGMSGVEAIIAIRSQFHEARIAVLTMELGDVQIQRALAAGAKGYILKGMPMSEILEVIHAIHAGQMRIPGIIASQLAEHMTEKGLSARELQVLRLIAVGRRNKQIGCELLISEETVKMHVQHLMTKLNANDRTHAVTIAVQRGVIDL
jgi:DNA-binding NarL/FixJ family response regulator